MASITACFASLSIRDQRVISSMVRSQPRQRCVGSSILQILIQGDATSLGFIAYFSPVKTTLPSGRARVDQSCYRNPHGIWVALLPKSDPILTV